MPAVANVVAGGALRDPEYRLVTSGGSTSVATLGVGAPRVLMNAQGTLGVGGAVGSDYFFSNALDTIVAAASSGNNSRQAPRIMYTGANYDFGGTTQKLYADIIVFTGSTVPAGTFTVSLCPFTISGTSWVKGTSVLSSSAVSLANVSAVTTSTTATINKPADGLYMFTYQVSAIPLSTALITATLYVQNI